MGKDRLEQLMHIRCEGDTEPHEEFLEQVVNQLAESQTFTPFLRIL